MTKLDVDEHFYLALNAIKQQDHESAILSLKNIGEGEYFIRAQYLLAAEYAQIGMYERALEGFANVIAADPTMTIVAIQKALLHLVMNQSAEAKQTLAKLVADERESDAIYWFAKGLTAVTEQQSEEAIALLRRGIALNGANAPLNDDMQKVIDQLLAGADSSKNITEELAETLITPSAANKFLMTNYKNDEV